MLWSSAENVRKCVRRAFLALELLPAVSLTCLSFLCPPAERCESHTYSRAVISSPFLLFSHTLDTSSILSHGLIPPLSHNLPSLLPPLSFFLPGPYFFPDGWESLSLGKNESTVTNFSHLPGGTKSVYKQEPGRGEEIVGSEKRNKKEWEKGRTREIEHQAGLCTLLGQYLNAMQFCRCLIRLSSSHSTVKKTPRKPFPFFLWCEELNVVLGPFSPH